MSLGRRNDADLGHHSSVFTLTATAYEELQRLAGYGYSGWNGGWNDSGWQRPGYGGYPGWQSGGYYARPVWHRRWDDDDDD